MALLDRCSNDNQMALLSHNAVTITRWQYYLSVVMITRWHYSVEIVIGWIHWIVNVSKREKRGMQCYMKKEDNSLIDVENVETTTTKGVAI